jgi:hypothetical protein
MAAGKLSGTGLARLSHLSSLLDVSADRGDSGQKKRNLLGPWPTATRVPPQSWPASTGRARCAARSKASELTSASKNELQHLVEAITHSLLSGVILGHVDGV